MPQKEFPTHIEVFSDSKYAFATLEACGAASRDPESANTSTFSPVFASSCKSYTVLDLPPV